jgi:hypothetical protein
MRLPGATSPRGLAWGLLLLGLCGLLATSQAQLVRKGPGGAGEGREAWLGSLLFSTSARPS